MASENISSTDQMSQTRRVSRIFGQYIIKSHFQFKFSLVIFSFLAIAALIIYLEGRWAVDNMITSGAVTGEEAILQLKLLNGIIGRTSILALAITFGVSLFFSHFVAGPIYRFQKVLDEMRDGNLNLHVKLRKHDELKDVADTFNQALSSLRHRLRKDRATINVAVERAMPLIEKLKKQKPSDEITELGHILTDLKNTPPNVQI